MDRGQIIREVKNGNKVSNYRPLVRDLVRSNCTKPVLLKNNQDMYTNSKYDVYVPCGECDNCRNNKSNQLFSRLFIAAKELQHAYFITNTYGSYDKPEDIPYQLLDAVWHYDDKNSKHRLCWRPCLIQYSHIQDYIKKLRVYLERQYNYSVSIMYYVGAEYGSSNGSPHFHLIILCNEKIDLELFHKAWSIDGKSIGKVQIDDLFENGSMYGIGLGNAKKCFKYCAKYAGKANPLEFNTTRVSFAYNYFFNQLDNDTAVFNYSDRVIPISLQRISQSQLDNLVLKIQDKSVQLERAVQLRDRNKNSTITRLNSKYEYWSDKANKYFDELRKLNVEYNKNKRVCYVSKENYAMDEESIKFGVPDKVFKFYNENRLDRYIRMCKSKGVDNPRIDENRMYYKSRQEFVPILFKEFCSIYRQSGHISTGSTLKGIYNESYSERVAQGNKRMPKAALCSLSSTATQRNSSISIQFPDYFNYLDTKERLPFSLYCRSLKQGVCFHKLTIKNHLEYWYDLYNAAITYSGPLRINKYVELNWSHICKSNGEPPIKAVMAYVQLVGPYKYGNRINTLSIKSNDGIFDQYEHKHKVVLNSVNDLTFSSLYNRSDGEYYRLVIGRTEDGLTDVKFAVYYRDGKDIIFDRYETFRKVFEMVQEQFDNYQCDWIEKRRFMDDNTDFYNVINYGKEITSDNIMSYELERQDLETRDYYQASSSVERMSIQEIYDLTQEYISQVNLNDRDWSDFKRDKEYEHINKNRVY